MVSNGYDAEPSPVGTLAASWPTALVLGALTLILGIVLSFKPTGSLNVVAVLLGILMLLSGVFHLVRVFDPRESHRVWLGITGLLFIVIGVILIRHLHLTRSIIGLVIGITWVVQGLTALIGGLSGGTREGRAWWISLRGGEPGRRDRRRGHPGVLAHRPRRPARHLVHRHGYLRDHRRADSVRHVLHAEAPREMTNA